MWVWEKIVRTPFFFPVRRIVRIANERKHDAIHLFLLSPPLCGSTVIAELLNTSPYVTIFPGNVEGQLLPQALPILFGDTRWAPDYEIDWVKVKNIFNSYWSPFKAIRVEKSPPHIARASELERVFMNSYFIITIRNPYAQIEGLLRRRWPWGEYGPSNICTVALTPTTAAEFWVRSARYQMQNRISLKNVLFFTYEELTDEADKVAQKITDFLPEIGFVDVRMKFSAWNVTGKPIKGLKNLNKEKIDKLMPADIEEINMILSKNHDVLKAFNYELIDHVK